MDEGDQAAIGVDAVGEHVAADGVLVGAADLIRQVVEELDAGETQQPVAGGVGPVEPLVGLLTVGLITKLPRKSLYVIAYHPAARTTGAGIQIQPASVAMRIASTRFLALSLVTILVR